MSNDLKDLVIRSIIRSVIFVMTWVIIEFLVKGIVKLCQAGHRWWKRRKLRQKAQQKPYGFEAQLSPEAEQICFACRKEIALTAAALKWKASGRDFCTSRCLIADLIAKQIVVCYEIVENMTLVCNEETCQQEITTGQQWYWWEHNAKKYGFCNQTHLVANLVARQQAVYHQPETEPAKNLDQTAQVSKSLSAETAQQPAITNKLSAKSPAVATTAEQAPKQSKPTRQRKILSGIVLGAIGALVLIIVYS